MTDSPDEVQTATTDTQPLRFLTVAQVADELATRPTLIRGLITTGHLPAIQIGGRGQWRIERVKLEEYISVAYARAAAEIKRGDLAVEDAANPSEQ